MKKQSIILACALVALMSCTKSKEVHPEIGDGNDEIVTVGMTDVHVEYTRTDHAELQKVVFYYSLAEIQEFEAAEMNKRENFFELTLIDLLSDTLYHYYYELFPNSGDVFNTSQKTFHTQAIDQPQPPTPPVAELPTVVTAEVSEITTNSAICGGEVTTDGGANVTECGICWSPNVNPTLDDNHIVKGIGEGAFTAAINGLEANTTYHFRAYATNEVGTAYGMDKEFTTLSGGGSGVPEGAIKGLFTINENGDQVYFSQGNLQYQASTNTWRFAENQWDYVGTQYPYIGSAGGTVNGSDNTYISPTYDGWIDLFGWATSGWNNGNLYYQPYNSEIDYDNNINNSFGYGPTDGTNYNYDLTGNYANADWGIFNAIANGGNMSGNWRTLKQREWMYILFNRSTVSGKRYAKAQVNGVNGIILLPDNWITSYYNLSDTDLQNAYYNTNIISVAQWNIIENAGAIFIPAAGIRDGVLVYACGTTANYWAASIAYADQNCANVMGFGEGGFNLSGNGLDAGDFKYYGLSVRLVHDVE